MDNASIQEAVYKTQSLFGIMADKLGVGIAKIKHSDEDAALGIAIIKATRQDELVPKEKHVRVLLDACVGSPSASTLDFVVLGLFKRLEENAKTWLVTLKSLIVFHRLLREADRAFLVELLHHGDGTGRPRLFCLDTFSDTTTKETSDYSAWIRAYSSYLDERLAVLRLTRFDPARETLAGNATKAQQSQAAAAPAESGASGEGAGEAKPALEDLSVSDLLENVAGLQRLLGQALACVPEGAARENDVTLSACSLVLLELLPVYHETNEAVRRLVDRIFTSAKADAEKGEELVKSYKVLTGKLAAFVDDIGGVPALQGAVQLPTLQPLPDEVLARVEEYVKDAPTEAPKPPSASPPSMADLLGFQSFIFRTPDTAAAPAAAAAAVSGATTAAAAVAAAAAAPPVSFDPFASYTAPEPPKPPADPLDQVFGGALEALTLAVAQDQQEPPAAAVADGAPAASPAAGGSSTVISPASTLIANTSAPSPATDLQAAAAATATISVGAVGTGQPYSLKPADPMDSISKELFGDRTPPPLKPMRPDASPEASAADAAAAGAAAAPSEEGKA